MNESLRNGRGSVAAHAAKGLERLLVLCGEDPALRSGLRSLAAALDSLTRNGKHAHAPSSRSDAAVERPVRPEPATETAGMHRGAAPRSIADPLALPSLIAIPRPANAPRAGASGRRPPAARTSPTAGPSAGGSESERNGSEEKSNGSSVAAGRPASDTALDRLRRQIREQLTASGRRSEAAIEHESALISRRTRVKAVICRMVAAAVEADAPPAAAPARPAEAGAPGEDSTLASLADLAEPDLWMLELGEGLAGEFAGAWLRLGECYSALHDAVELIRKAESTPGLDGRTYRSLLLLLAEAQSALRVAVQAVRPGAFDRDQNAAFAWLKQITQARGFRLTRHMTLDDPADPQQSPQLRRRIQKQTEQFLRHHQLELRLDAALDRLSYAVQRMQDPSGPGPNAREELVNAIDQAVALGLPPSDVRLRDVVLQHRALIENAKPTPRLRRVLHALEEYEAKLKEQAESETTAAPAGWTGDVLKVREWVKGREVVLIGGVRDPAREDALRRAFGCKELIWLDAPEHRPIDGAESTIGRAGVVLVLVLIRLVSHQHVEEARHFGARFGKVVVLIKSGHHANQIAAQIVEQASGHLSRLE